MACFFEEIIACSFLATKPDLPSFFNPSVTIKTTWTSNNFEIIAMIFAYNIEYIL
jgi:hypothetical protein